MIKNRKIEGRRSCGAFFMRLTSDGFRLRLSTYGAQEEEREPSDV
jgi:hypothetical protein